MRKAAGVLMYLYPVYARTKPGDRGRPLLSKGRTEEATLERLTAACIFRGHDDAG